MHSAMNDAHWRLAHKMMLGFPRVAAKSHPIGEPLLDDPNRARIIVDLTTQASADTL